jgi:peptidoglycan/xylan/chitin deacetylase (PgdA/CDA1 family)
MRWLVEQLAKRHPDVVYYVETAEPVIALTIDDGPDPATTPAILDLLEQHGVRATFFVIGGRVEGNEALIERMVRDGHEIANHMMAERASIRLEPAEFERELVETHRVLSRFANVKRFRPGSGWWNDRMLETLERHDYRLALASVYPFDPQIPSSWFASRFVLWAAKPGSVIALHDAGGRGERTLETLSRVLPGLARRGYRVVPLADLERSASDATRIE